MADYLVTDTELTNIANAIRTKGGTNSSLSFPTGFVNAIGNITTSSEPAKSNDVNFYDYDGTIVYSYSAADFAQLSAMPANPSHTGLTAQGWNWTLAQAKTWVAEYGVADIGQMYITNDGKTRLYIYIQDTSLGATSIYWNQTVSNGITVDWGDNSSITTVSGTGAVHTSHTYAAKGYYTISLNCTSGTFYLGVGSGAGEKSIFNISGTNINLRESTKLLRVEYGSNTTITGNYAFIDCTELQYATIPNNITAISAGTFYGATSLVHLTIPSAAEAIHDDNIQPGSEWDFYPALRSISLPYRSYFWLGYYSVATALCLKRLIIPYPYTDYTYLVQYAIPGNVAVTDLILPEGYTAIQEGAIYNYYSISVFTLPSTITSIQAYGIGMRNLKILHLKPTTPPTLTAANSVVLPDSCIIYVPKSTNHTVLNAYKAATNWSQYASQMQEEP